MQMPAAYFQNFGLESQKLCSLISDVALWCFCKMISLTAPPPHPKRHTTEE